MSKSDDAKGGRWSRLHKRGAMVAFFTVVGGLACGAALWLTAGGRGLGDTGNAIA